MVACSTPNAEVVGSSPIQVTKFFLICFPGSLDVLILIFLHVLLDVVNIVICRQATCGCLRKPAASWRAVRAAYVIPDPFGAVRNAYVTSPSYSGSPLEMRIAVIQITTLRPLYLSESQASICL